MIAGCKGLLIAWTTTFAAFAAMPAHAAFDALGWAWQRPIVGMPERSGYVRLSLTPEVLDASQPTLADLRVLDGEGELVPFVLRRSGVFPLTETVWTPATLLNRVYQPGRYARVTADFGQAQRRNRIRVATSGENYRRRVTVEGSVDGVSWDFLLEAGWLFHVPLAEMPDVVDEVAFPESDFRYLRVTVYNMPDDPREIEIATVEGRAATGASDTALLPVETRRREAVFDEKSKSTEHEFDLGYRHLPVVSVEFTIDDPLFYRAYELLGRNSETEPVRYPTETRWAQREAETPWLPVARGVLYRIPHESGVSANCDVTGIEAPYRYLKLRVYEQDNPPLRVASASAERRDVALILMGHPNASYRLIGGNADAAPAAFDLSRTIGTLDEHGLPGVSLGDATVLEPGSPAVPWAERYRLLLWVALVIAVGVVATLIVRNLARLRDA